MELIDRVNEELLAVDWLLVMIVDLPVEEKVLDRVEALNGRVADSEDGSLDDDDDDGVLE